MLSKPMKRLAKLFKVKERSAHRYNVMFAILVLVPFVGILLSYGSSPEPDPEELVEIRPEDFGGVDICLRDTEGGENACSRRFSIVREESGKRERICKVSRRAVTGLQKAREELKKINPDLELMVISTYRPPGYQQCLRVKKTRDGKYRCKSTVCGPRDPKTRERLPCREYDLEDPRYADIYNHCPHVNGNTVDLCTYDRTKVKLNKKRNQMDMTVLEDCQSSLKPNYRLPDGWIYHPCTCRLTSWDQDIRTGSARTKIFTSGDIEDVQTMAQAMRAAGWADYVRNEWWHFRYVEK